MKTKLLGILLAGTVSFGSAFAQGTIDFKNLGSGGANTGTSVNAPIFNGFTGIGLTGTGFSVQLFFSSSPSGPFTAVGTPSSFLNNPFFGYFNGGTLQIPGFGTGTQPFLMVAAWDNASGTITDFNSAIFKGSSQPFQSPPLGPSTLPPSPADLPTIQGMTSFAIPEPSVVTFASFGALAVMLRLRRKQ